MLASESPMSLFFLSFLFFIHLFMFYKHSISGFLGQFVYLGRKCPYFVSFFLLLQLLAALKSIFYLA